MRASAERVGAEETLVRAYVNHHRPFEIRRVLSIDEDPEDCSPVDICLVAN